MLATVPTDAGLAATTDTLTPTELHAWRGLLRAHALVVKRLDAELEAVHGLPLTSYEVLLHLSAAEDSRMRMCDLAEGIMLSRSGLTRLVDRLERDGLVERVSCSDDARGAFARLTEAGEAKLREAAPTHLNGIRRHFLAHVTPEQLRVLGEVWDAIAGSAAAGAPRCDGS